MESECHSEPSPPPAGEAESPARRRFGRVRQHTLYCNLGEVLDICADGMRIRGRKVSSKHPHEVRLKGFSLPGPLWGAAVWFKRLGLFKWEVGLRFQDTSPEVIQRLTTIAGCGGLRRLQAPPQSKAA